MSENIMEANPYDRLIEQEPVPVKSPVIFSGEMKPVKEQQTLEMIPLTENAVYEEVQIKELKEICTIEIETEDDFLVPDINPDMESILNIQGFIAEASAGEDDISGTVKLEVLYRSADTYGETICLIPAEVNFKKAAGEKLSGKEKVHCRIESIEHRIINERKYKVKLHIRTYVREVQECTYDIFKEIKNEPMQIKCEPVTMLNYLCCKTRESEVNEELLINNEKIRPVKIIKSEFVVSENHRQMTREKIIINESIWVRILYMAENASKGNIMSQPVLYCGKIDHTQFVPLSKEECEAEICVSELTEAKLTAEINSVATGFIVTGDLYTESGIYKKVEKEMASDFYHLKEEITCDMKETEICTGIHCVKGEHILRDSIDIMKDNEDGARVIYMDARITECNVRTQESKALVSGKVQLEVVTADDRERTVLGRKNCTWETVLQLPECRVHKMASENIFVKEMTADVTVNGQVSITAAVCISLYTEETGSFQSISNLCIIRSDIEHKEYPVTVYTVKSGESVWDIAKKFKVREEMIKKVNKPEFIAPGNKIVIVK